MRVLVACEFSGTVRRAFRDRGHDAWSCDLLPAEDGSEFHIQYDIRKVLITPDWAQEVLYQIRGIGLWDLMLAFPPCTHLAVSGAKHFKEKRQDGRQDAALQFVRDLMAFFVDNTFNLPVSYALELCRRITEAGLKITWRCIFNPGKVSRPLVEAMAKAGCRDVSLGFDSGCESVLQSMNKHFGAQEIREASHLLAEFGIKRIGFLLLGGPGETKASVEESLAFADSLKLDALKLTIRIRIYPHTGLARQAVAEGLIAPGDSLLYPRFYLVEELQPWLRETVVRWAEGRPYCFF